MNLNSKYVPNKSEETNQKPAGGFLIAHFKRYLTKKKYIVSIIYPLHFDR